MKKRVASRDFKESDLPSNRKEVFFDCLKNRYKEMFYCGLLLFLTAIPFIVLLIVKSLNSSSLLYALNQNSITDEEYNSLGLFYSFVYDFLIIISSFIISIGICGLTRVIRQIGWEEPIFFIKDYKDGIKMNYKQIAFHLFIVSLIYSLIDLSKYIGTDFKFFKYIQLVIFIFVVIPIFFYSIAQVNIYDMNVSKEITNSLLLFLMSVPGCILFSLILVIALLIDLIPNILISLLIYSLLIMLIIPIYYLAWFLYSSRILDKCINKDNYPEIFDKGIYRRK